MNDLSEQDKHVAIQFATGIERREGESVLDHFAHASSCTPTEFQQFDELLQEGYLPERASRKVFGKDQSRACRLLTLIAMLDKCRREYQLQV